MATDNKKILVTAKQKFKTVLRESISIAPVLDMRRDMMWLGLVFPQLSNADIRLDGFNLEEKVKQKNIWIILHRYGTWKRWRHG